MAEQERFRVFATSRIGNAGENLLRARGYDLEVFQGPEAPPKKLVIEKVKSGIDGLITTLRDPIDAEVFEAGKGSLKVVAQIAVGFDNINRADANRYKIPFTNTADVLTEATAEFAFFMMGMLARKMWQSEQLVRQQKWPSWHPFLPFLGDEVTGWVDYRRIRGRFVAIHTEVRPEFGGRGIGSALVRRVLADARQAGVKVTPKCPLFVAHFERHPEDADLVEMPGRRA